MDQTETLIIRQQKEDSPFYIFSYFCGQNGKAERIIGSDTIGLEAEKSQIRGPAVKFTVPQ